MAEPKGKRAIPAAPSPLRRFDHHQGKRRPIELAPDHPAVTEGRTLFQSQRRFVEETRHVLVGGHNSRKIGKVVTKGRWAGYPIYTLTLEERATCPRSCSHWRDCYGNGSHWALRIQPDGDFEDVLWLELEALNRKHPGGFVVRLHVLGDFYSVAYVELWRRALTAFPALHVFGYTARDPVFDRIGRMLQKTAAEQWSRFAMRFSGHGSTGAVVGAITVEKGEQPVTAIVCPAQTGKTECCGTCTLCWTTLSTIAFERH